MLITTNRYDAGSGWEKPLSGELDSDRTLLLLFGPSDMAPLETALADLRRTFANSIWMGCSSAGEIEGRTLGDDTLAIAVARFEHTALRLACCAISESGDSFGVGKSVAAALAAPDLKGVFVLSDGLSANGSELARGLSEILPAQVLVAGGLAGDGSRFQHTWTLVDRRPAGRQVTAVGFYGDRLGIACASRGGWDVLGPERRVTKSVANVLYQLDGQPALALYRKYLGERASGLPATGLLFPLSIRNHSEQDELTVRTILSVNESENSITFAGDIPQGALVRLMRANLERLIDGAAGAAERVDLSGYGGGALLAVAISCVGRRLVLGQRTEEEIDAVLDGLPPETALVGYYSYGELSPLASGRCDLKNQTMTLTLLWEN